MSWKRLAWSTSALVCALALTNAADAQSIDPIELRVMPDARACVTEAALRARIARLHAQVEGTYGLSFALDAASEPAVLEVRRNDIVIATRRFDALPERCADRLQTLALVITLAIEHAATPDDGEEPDAPAEPETVSESESATVEPEPAAPERAATAEPAPAASVESDDATAEHDEPSLRVIAGIGGAYGLLPELSGTLALGVELPSGALRIGLGALVTSETRTGLAGGTALTQLAGARAYGCAGGAALALDLQACAGLTLGVVAGSGRDYTPSNDAYGTLLAPLLRLGARYPAQGLFSLGLALEAFVNLVRPELQVSGNAGGASAFSPFGALLSLEVVLALP